MHQRLRRKHCLFSVIGNSLRGGRDFVNGDYYYHMSVIVSGNKNSDIPLSLLYITEPSVTSCNKFAEVY